MRVLAYILTAAAVLIGADIFVASPEGTSTPADMTSPTVSLGDTGAPTPPPNGMN